MPTYRGKSPGKAKEKLKEKSKDKAKSKVEKPRNRGPPTGRTSIKRPPESSSTESSSGSLGPYIGPPPIRSNNLDKVIPAWADNRYDLSESLEYFRDVEAEVYEKDGMVHGCLLCDEDGFTTEHIGAQIVIVRFGIPADRYAAANVALAEARHRRKATANRLLYNAIVRTYQQQSPVALILDGDCDHCPVDPTILPGRFCVMSHFRISELWAEPNLGLDTMNQDDVMIRFQKVDLDSDSWWFPEYLDPSPQIQLGNLICNFCNFSSHHVRGVWMCLNQRCDAFFCRQDLTTPTEEQLNHFDGGFLEQRATWTRDLLVPATSLTPPLPAVFSNERTDNRIRALTKGLVCPKCNKCIPRIFWNGWACSGCNMKYNAQPGDVPLLDIVNRPTVSFTGHPPLNPQCPAENVHTLAMARRGYRLDRFSLHGDTTVLLMSPTAETNAAGADGIWTDLLKYANNGNIDLQRTLLRPDLPELGIRTQHFHVTMGNPYDFSGRTPMDEIPIPVSRAVDDVITPLFRAELGQDHYELPTSVQILGYMDKAVLPWHTDGDEEVGQTIATMSLGGDAEMRIRLQKKYYENDELDPNDIIVGARYWRELQQLIHDRETGAVGAHDAAARARFYTRDKGTDPRPEILLPLIHGSVVIIHGRAFSKLYEHEIRCRDSLRFAITQRRIDSDLHDMVGLRTPGSRLAGQKFIGPRGLFTDLPGYLLDDEYEFEAEPEPEDPQDEPGEGRVAGEEARHAPPVRQALVPPVLPPTRPYVNLAMPPSLLPEAMLPATHRPPVLPEVETLGPIRRTSRTTAGVAPMPLGEVGPNDRSTTQATAPSLVDRRRTSRPTAKPRTTPRPRYGSPPRVDVGSESGTRKLARTSKAWSKRDDERLRMCAQGAKLRGRTHWTAHAMRLIKGRNPKSMRERWLRMNSGVVKMPRLRNEASLEAESDEDDGDGGDVVDENDPDDGLDH